MVSFLWAGVIAGLVCVVRDCMRDRHLEPPLSNLEVEEWQPCCKLDGFEILPIRHEQS